MDERTLEVRRATWRPSMKKVLAVAVHYEKENSQFKVSLRYGRDGRTSIRYS